MYCWNCGDDNPETYNYCGNCGKPPQDAKGSFSRIQQKIDALMAASGAGKLKGTVHKFERVQSDGSPRIVYTADGVTRSYDSLDEMPPDMQERMQRAFEHFESNFKTTGVSDPQTLGAVIERKPIFSKKIRLTPVRESTPDPAKQGRQFRYWMVIAIAIAIYWMIN